MPAVSTARRAAHRCPHRPGGIAARSSSGCGLGGAAHAPPGELSEGELSLPAGMPWRTPTVGEGVELPAWTSALPP